MNTFAGKVVRAAQNSALIYAKGYTDGMGFLGLKLYMSAEYLSRYFENTKYFFTSIYSVEKLAEGDREFVRFTEKNVPSADEIYFQVPFSKGIETGRYLALRYRAVDPATETHGMTNVQCFAADEGDRAQDNAECFLDSKKLSANEWHTLVFDAATMPKDGFLPDEDGKYRAAYIRFDLWNGPDTEGVDSNTIAVSRDVEFVATSNSLDSIIAFCGDVLFVSDGGARIIRRAVDGAPEPTEGIVYTYGTVSGGIGTAAVSGYSGGDTDIVIPSITFSGGNAYAVRSINQYAFDGKGLGVRAIYIPESVESIGNRAFRETRLKKLVLCEGLKTIGQKVFADIVTLGGNLVIPNSVTSIGWSAFSNTGITSVVIGDGLTEIPIDCFYNCQSMTSAEIGASVTIVGDRAFHNCIRLENVAIKDGGAISRSFSLAKSAKLTRASIESIVGALSDTASGQTLTLAGAAVAKAFEMSEGAGDGVASGDWYTLVNTKTNWTITLVW